MSANGGSKRGILMLIIGLVVGLVGGVFLAPTVAPMIGGDDAKTVAASALPVTPAPPKPVITALGRLRPGKGIVRVSGPSHLAVVVHDLLVEEGDRVQQGQVIAVLDNNASQSAAVDRLKASVEAQQAAIARAEAELRNARNEAARLDKLHREGTVSDSQRDSARLQADSAEANVRRARAEINLARADLRRAEKELEMTVVRSPINAQVVKVHTRAGEKVDGDGIVELADNEQMYAVAEVYETDVARIQVGQRATVKTPVFDQELSGTVERIGLKIGKMDVLGTDPAAKTDARVVEVEIRLDDSSRVNASTNLQVTVAIDVAKQNPQAAAGA
jgi:HlyD family secretion protein